MKKTLVLMSVVAILASGCTKNEPAQAPELKNMTDTLSSSLGTIVAADACYSDLVDYNAMIDEAVKDVTDGNIAKINQIYAYVNALEIISKGYAELDQNINTQVLLYTVHDILDRYRDSMDVDKIREKEKVAQEYVYGYLQKKATAYHNEFLAGVDKTEGIKKSESGLRYIIDKKGRRVGDTDTLAVNYVLKDYQGKEIDSSKDGSFLVFMRTGNVVKGFIEAVSLAGYGGKIRAWVPADLGYGSEGTGKILPGQTLVFEIEVLKKISKNDMK